MSLTIDEAEAEKIISTLLKAAREIERLREAANNLLDVNGPRGTYDAGKNLKAVAALELALNEAAL